MPPGRLVDLPFPLHDDEDPERLIGVLEPAVDTETAATTSAATSASAIRLLVTLSRG